MVNTSDFGIFSYAQVASLLMNSLRATCERVALIFLASGGEQLFHGIVQALFVKGVQVRLRSPGLSYAPEPLRCRKCSFPSFWHSWQNCDGRRES